MQLTFPEMDAIRVLVPAEEATPAETAVLVDAFVERAFDDLGPVPFSVLIARAMGGAPHEVAEHVGLPEAMVRWVARRAVRQLRDRDPGAWSEVTAWLRAAVEHGGSVVASEMEPRYRGTMLSREAGWSVVTYATALLEEFRMRIDLLAPGVVLLSDPAKIDPARPGEWSFEAGRFALPSEVEAATGVPAELLVRGTSFFDGVALARSGHLYSLRWPLERAVHAIARMVETHWADEWSVDGLAEAAAALFADREGEWGPEAVRDVLERHEGTEFVRTADGGWRTMEAARVEDTDAAASGDGEESSGDPALAGVPGWDDLDELARSVVEVLVVLEQPLTARQIAAQLDRDRREVVRSLQGPLLEAGAVETNDGRRFVAASAPPNADGEGDHGGT